ncbi:MAG: hypothetical protein DRO98_07480 [Archaeoglobales archaeon]|nr:MAG: hypothetical protein DRO98_07480 [Archaeoglobales archaeon]
MQAHKTRIEFAVNGLTKSGSILYINIPAKIRPLLKKNAIYKVTLEEISDPNTLSGGNGELK